jgi:hypothetical protein
MTWTFAVVGGWLVLSVVVALALGRTLALRDRQVARRPELRGRGDAA